MNTSESIIPLLGRLWAKIGLRRRKQFTLLFVLMLISSFAEIISIGVVLPFLGMLSAPERIFEMPAFQPAIRILGLTEAKQLLLPLTLCFGIAAMFAGVMRLAVLWASTRLSFAAGADLSIAVYRHTLYRPYEVHCAHNSSDVINSVSGKSDRVIYNIIMPCITFLSSSVILISILITLLILQPKVSLIAFGGFGFIYVVIIYLTRKQLFVDSKCMARESTRVIKALQEGLGSIRDVIIDGSQEIYCKVYRNADLPLRRAQGNSVFISASPRYGIEALALLLIAVLAYYLAQQVNGISMAIPILGMLAFGAQRLLPALQQAYSSWVQINSGYASLEDTLDLLDEPLPDYAHDSVIDPLPFNRDISLRQLSFSYGPNTPHVLKCINLTIAKGSRVGFIGPTGSGKSTLVDIVMGLLHPTDGTLEIDGQTITLSNHRAWQSHISHVPQAIFLTDSTVEENIAFGIPREQIDHDRVKLAAQQAQVANTIENWPKGYQTFVGERGIRLSGGQRQRIGIARALYKQSDVIIFDEATSALDNETEQAVMRAIENLSANLTVIIIAHRLTTLKNCTQIVQLGDGVIKRVGSYQEIVN